MACSLNLGANPFRFAAHGIHLLDELTNPLGDQLSRSHDVELNSKVYAWMKPRHDELGPSG